jgi:hypothetical protein
MIINSSVSEATDLFFGNDFFELLHRETNLHHHQLPLNGFLEISSNTYSKKLLAADKEGKNIGKGVKHATCTNTVWCLYISVNISRDITLSASTKTFDE